MLLLRLKQRTPVTMTPSVFSAFLLACALPFNYAQYGSIYILGLAHPVTEGEQVILLCHYWFRKPNRTTFYKDGVEVVSLNDTEMTIDNVISADEGFYKCADPDKKVESPEKKFNLRRQKDMVH